MQSLTYFVSYLEISVLLIKQMENMKLGEGR